MRRILLAIAALAAVTSAAAQPDQYGWRRDPRALDPEVRAALADYCRIMKDRVERHPRLIMPRVCRRYFPGMFYPQQPRRTP